MTPAVGERLPVLERELSLVSLVVYAGATWDWQRMHYDAAASGSERPVADGQMLGALLAKQAMDWGGPGAWVTRMGFRFKAMVFAGDTVRCESEVVGVQERAGGLLVDLRQWVTCDRGPAIEHASLVLRVDR